MHVPDDFMKRGDNITSKKRSLYRIFIFEFLVNIQKRTKIYRVQTKYWTQSIFERMKLEMWNKYLPVVKRLCSIT